MRRSDECWKALGASLSLTLKNKYQVNWTGIAEPNQNHPSKDRMEYYYILNNLDVGKCEDGELQGSEVLSW